MKKIHIIAIIIVAVGIAIIFGSLANSSTYANFDQAFGNPGTEFHVVGTLNREKPTEYTPEVNPDLFSFYMYDSDSLERKVVLYQHKPQDFERSEQIVLIGKAEGDAFHASKILLKCPSKYKDGSPEETTSPEMAGKR